MGADREQYNVGVIVAALNFYFERCMCPAMNSDLKSPMNFAEFLDKGFMHRQ